MLIADDYSGDGAPEYVKSRPEYGSQLFLVERRTKEGLARAYFAGFEWALQKNYDYILQMDADLSHDPLDLPRLLERAAQGDDLVLASRYCDGIRVLNWEISRLLLSLWASFYVRMLTRMPFTDPTGGFKCYPRRIAPKNRGQKDRLAGIRLSNRDSFLGLDAAGQNQRSADHFRPAQKRRIEDVPCDRRGSFLAGRPHRFPCGSG